MTDLVRSCNKVAYYNLKCVLSNTVCCFTHKTRYAMYTVYIVSLCIIMYIALSLDNVVFIYLFIDLTIRPLLIH